MRFSSLGKLFKRKMDNETIARKFYRLSDLMEIRGDDRFRIRSYRNAAGTIETWPTPLSRIAALMVAMVRACMLSLGTM